MFATLENGIGLDMVVWLQAGGSPLLDGLALALHFLGSSLAYLVLLPLIYWSVDRRLGRYLLLALVLSILTSEVMKHLFQAPRPHQVNPDLVRDVVNQSGHGFPSGHVAGTLAVCGFLALWSGRWWAMVAAGAYTLLMGWGRMYAGAHFPQDVVGGVVVGLAVIFFAARLAEPIFRRWRRLPWFTGAAVVIVLCAITIAVFYREENALSVAGLVLGGGLGVMLQERFAPFAVEGTLLQRGLRTVIGLILLLVLYLGLGRLFADIQPEAILRVVRYGIITAFVVAGWPWLAARAGLFKQTLPEMYPSSVAAES